MNPFAVSGRFIGRNVVKARHRIEKKDYAVKIVPYKKPDEDRVYQEVLIHARLSHKNLVGYKTSFTTDYGEQCRVD